MERSFEWWRGSVIYQIYPRSFRDANGDGIGDLAGITERLPHIADLGVDAIWIAPFFKSPMKDFGYDVSDYCAVDPLFGTIEDFDRLVARAHGLGLKVLIDQVWSHSSDQHDWFLDSRASRTGDRSDWYVWADPRPDGTPPNNWMSVFGGSAWTWEPRRRQYYLHHFLSSQPQLNLRNPALVEALFATGAFWLDRGVDGFRLDAIDFMMHDPELRDNPAAPPADGLMPIKPFRLQWHLNDMMHADIYPFMGDIKRFMSRWPGTATLGEVSSEGHAVARCGRYTSGGRLDMAYTLRLLKREFSADLIRDALVEAGAGEGWLCWAFSNHDVERAVSRWNHGVAEDDFGRLLMALLLSLRGSVCVYQGEELGLPEAEIAQADLQDPYGITFYPEFKGRDGCRTPMPWSAEAPLAGFSTAERSWLPVPEAHRLRAADLQQGVPGSLLGAWQQFLAWRKAQPALRLGELKLLEIPGPVVAFERVHAGERMLAVFNLSAAPIELDLKDWLDPEEWRGCRTLDGHGFAAEMVSGRLSLPRFGVFYGQLEAARALVAAE
jgi:alpha-glucosidase